MVIEASDKGSYRLLRIKEDIGANTDLTELRAVVSEYLGKGQKDFALAFSKESYLYTRSIAVLISCSEMIKERDGRLAMIEANEDILDLLSLIDFDRVIRVFASESELILDEAAT